MAEKKFVEKTRRWVITIHNPQDIGLTHDKIKSILKQFPSLVYWCMSDEIGLKTKIYHTHLYICSKNGIRFSTLKNRFHSSIHLENAVRSSEEIRNYMFKAEKWEKSKKAITRVEGTQEEWGTLPDDGLKHTKKEEKFYGTLYKLIEDGLSDAEIIAYNPNYIPMISKFPIIRNAIRTKDFTDSRRTIKVVYVWGAYRWDKVREIRNTYGDENVYSIADYNHPFEDYDCQDVLILEEYFQDFEFKMLMHYLQEYPVKLSARYSNKVSCFTKVFIVSEHPLQDQYYEQQYKENIYYKNFLEKITKVVYCEDKDSFRHLEVNEQIHEPSELPFNEE